MDRQRSRYDVLLNLAAKLTIKIFMLSVRRFVYSLASTSLRSPVKTVSRAYILYIS